MSSITRFTLEVSAKPFYPIEQKSTYQKLRETFLLWYSVLKEAENPAILWWFGDGAEILEFTGDVDQSVPWAKWMGWAHQNFNILRTEDPDAEALSGHDWMYQPESGDITIRDMQTFVRVARQAAQEVLGKRLEMGIAFDPGSEFTQSSFRYEWHPEILISSGGALQCIDATARLKGDDRRYAAFPQGIPDGTTFGEFFGKQCREFFATVDFDYMWFSNSFGYGRSPYAFGATGEFFDGEQFLLEKNHEVRDEVLEFWKELRRHCGIRIANRGTDFTAGFNLVSQATPYRGLYSEIDNILPPPNTPWPALTKNRGIALAGMLSQIAAWPGTDFPYRFYLSDPWWLNSPWMDRYENNPSDIYITCALSRLTGDGRLDTVSEMALLSIDDSWGELPEKFPDTLIPHLKQGLEDRPDAAGPFIWVYPFDEFDRAVFDEKTGCERVICTDANIIQAVNRGLPVSTVMTAQDLVKIQSADRSKIAGCVLISIVPDAGSAWEDALLAHVEAGGQVLCYGSARHVSERFLAALGLKRQEDLTEGLRISSIQNPDVQHLREGAYAEEISLHPILSDGGVGEVLDDAEPLAQAGGPGGSTRALACRKGGLGWTRGISSIEKFGRRMEAHEVTEKFPCEIFFRHILDRFGWSFRFSQATPVSTNYYAQMQRSRNGFVLSATAVDPSTELRVRTPFGAPLFPRVTNRIENGFTLIDFAMQSWFHAPCRVFVEGQDGQVQVSLDRGSHHPIYRYAWYIEGLENATLRVFPWADCQKNTQILLNPNKHNTLGEDYDGGWEEQDGLRFLTLRNISGRVSFMWSPDDVKRPVPMRDHRVDG